MIEETAEQVERREAARAYTQGVDYNTKEGEKVLEKHMAFFPSSFGLSGFAGRVFRLAPSVYVHFNNQLIVQVKQAGGWVDFSRGTFEEIKRTLK